MCHDHKLTLTYESEIPINITDKCLGVYKKSSLANQFSRQEAKDTTHVLDVKYLCVRHVFLKIRISC